MTQARPISDSDILHLQKQLLRAVLAQEPLSGQTHVLYFPDLKYVLEVETPVISNENLGGPLDIGREIEVIAPEQLTERAQAIGQFPFLRFQSPEIQPDKVGLSLQVCMCFPDLEPLALGAAVANFQYREDTGWRAVEPTAALAY